MRTQIFSKAERPFDWFDIHSPDEAELELLAAELNIPGIYIQDILQAEHLPKTETIGEDDTVFLIARAIDPGNGKLEFNSIKEISNKIAIYYSHDRIITIHRRHFPWLEELIRKSHSYPLDTSPFRVVSSILKQSFRSFEPALFRMNADLEFYESKLLESEQTPPLARSLYGVKRKASVLQQLFTVSGSLAEFLKSPENPDPIAQDAYDMFQRINTLAEDVNERAASLINLNLAISGQRNNDVMRFLTVYSAFFLPLTFLVGIYGMNFEFMPELKHPMGYAATWILILLTTGFHLWWFRRKKWL